MKILFILPYALGQAPGQRYRVEQWLPHLRARGVACDVLPVLEPAEQRLLYSPASLARKVLTMGRCCVRALRRIPPRGAYDAVWIYRSVLLAGPPLLERLVQATGSPIVYEFDDAIWLNKTMAANRSLAFLKCSGKTAGLCRMARAVVVGNNYLADYSRAHNRNVWVIPSTVDTASYRPAEGHTPNPRPIIGWSGSPTTVEDLQVARGALSRLARAEDFELRVMGGTVSIPGVNVTLKEWSAGAELGELQRFDIGIMPLPDDPWRRGKCAMKALLYMSVGVPTVASPVGVNVTIIRDGHNGLLAATEDAWVAQLTRLLRDAGLRRRLGLAGRATVVEHFSPEVQVPRVVACLRSAARSRNGRGAPRP